MVHIPIKKQSKVYTSIGDVDFYKSSNIENNKNFLLLFLAALEFNAFKHTYKSP